MNPAYTYTSVMALFPDPSWHDSGESTDSIGCAAPPELGALER